MTKAAQARAKSQRYLLPRTPSDRVVVALLGAGLVFALLLRVEPVYGLFPGAAAALIQKVAEHVRAWRTQGVERAFVMESAALSFYLLLAALVGAAVIDAAGAHVPMAWLVLVALLIETMVRQVRSTHYA